MILFFLSYIHSLALSSTLSCTTLLISQSTTLLLRDGLNQSFAEALLQCVEDLLLVSKAYYAFIRVDMDEVSICTTYCMYVCAFSQTIPLTLSCELMYDRCHCVITNGDKG